MPFKNPHPLYGTWQAMKQRCYNKNNKHYCNYGLRGIRVCEEWKNDFHAFANFMGLRPKNMTLDRIDNDGDYSPHNCKWSTKSEQQQNQRITRIVTIDGKNYIAAKLSKIANVKTDSIIERSNRGLSYDEVISKEKLHNLSGLALGGKANADRQRAKTHCKHGHEYNERNTKWYKGNRSCKKCHAIREQNRRNILKQPTL